MDYRCPNEKKSKLVIKTPSQFWLQDLKFSTNILDPNILSVDS